MNEKRKGLGKRLRFAILERDHFTCQYCGHKAPSVALHIDHIHPVLHGGKSDPSNLITACADCNLGKNCKPLPIFFPHLHGFKWPTTEGGITYLGYFLQDGSYEGCDGIDWDEEDEFIRQGVAASR